ncbi:hypothetical protein SAY86_013460 [Trapa natans]|uniref:Uncharacterized protein n=1 Tax=Trapa natans TaxID=22666 RepID=A0AAN7RCL8_TRANT|nr:hypothetical protein SAY86_013460 [Trapa natans]
MASAQNPALTSDLVESVAPMQSPSSKGSGLSKLVLAKVVYKSRCDNLNEIVERTSGDKPEGKNMKYDEKHKQAGDGSLQVDP